MSRDLIKKMKPFNRHLLIVPHASKNEQEQDVGVLLPDGFKPEVDRYGLATVINIAKDCSESIRQVKFQATSDPMMVVVDRSMVEEVEIYGKKYYFILENYVLGALRGINEN